MEDTNLISTIESIELEASKKITDATESAKKMVEEARKLANEKFAEISQNLQSDRQTRRRQLKLEQEQEVERAIQEYKNKISKDIVEWQKSIPEAVDYLLERSLDFNGNR